jgi:hypothetical protein
MNKTSCFDYFCQLEKNSTSIDDVTSVDDFIRDSDSFNYKNEFPIHSSRCKTLRTKDYVTDDQLLKNINGCYPILHEDVLPLICSFLNHKKTNGSETEKSIYAGMGIPEFVDRLVAKRPLKFVGGCDSYILRGTRQPGGRGGRKDEGRVTRQTGAGGWERIGTDEEEELLGGFHDYVYS